MSENFEIRFSVPGDQHAATAPVLIRSGALVKSRESDETQARVMLKNLSSKTISAATVAVTAFDEQWTQAGDPVIHTFSGLSAGQDAQFGGDQTIELPDGDTHAISCACTEITFDDGTTWTAEPGAYWSPLEVRQPMAVEKIADPLLARQFLADLREEGAQGEFYPIEHEGLWYCACGTGNTDYDETCHKCGIRKEKLFALTDPDTLAEHRAAAVAAEEAEAQRLLEEKAKRKKKAVRLGAVCAGAAALACLFIFLIVPLIRYKSADSAIAEGDYEAAIATYSSLNAFMDSESHLATARALEEISQGGVESGIRTLLSQGIGVHVDYELEGGTLVENAGQTSILYAADRAFPGVDTAERDYYDFAGWTMTEENYSFGGAGEAFLTLRAEYLPTQYEITYNSEGDISNSNPRTYNYESAAITLSEPTRTGYSFLGWTDADGKAVDGVAIPTNSYGAQEFTAAWEPNEYTVTIVPGKEAPEEGYSFEQTVFRFIFDDPYELPRAARDGYVFQGWADGNGTYLEGTWDRAEDVTLEPSYKIITYMITYNLAGGEVARENVTSYNAQDVVTLSNPTRFGYDFTGWTWEDEDKPNPDVTLPAGTTGDKHFVANWQGHAHTVTLKVNGGTVSSNSVRVVYGSRYSLPTPTRAGYDFNGWYDGSTKYTSGTWDLDENITVSASWSAKKYTVTLDAAGGSCSTSSMTVTFDSSYSLPTPTRAGYDFKGWFSGGTQYSGGKWTTASNVTLRASWQGHAHTVRLNANGGSVPSSTVNVVYGSAYSLPTPTKTGYDFNGWYDGGTKYSGGTWQLDKDVSVTASWTAKQYTITLNAAGGSCSSSSIRVTYDSSYTLPTPTRTGYDFKGWYSGGTRYTGGTWNTPNNVTLTAQWEGKRYTVSLNANGGSVSPTSMTVTYGSSYSLPTPTRKGYDFKGWSTSSYSSSTFPSSGTWNTDNNVTLYAQWEQSKYTLTVNDPSGTYSGSYRQTVTYGSSVYLGSLSRTGYTFDGWYYGSTYLTMSSFTYNYESDITVTARWTADTDTIYLDANGGSVSQSYITVTYDGSYSLPTPYRDGYTFDGWYTSSYGGSYVYSSGTYRGSFGSSTLYAHWTELPVYSEGEDGY